MKSKFIGADKLVLYEAYSRKDVGYAHTQLALMNINEFKKIAFFNLSDKYDNKITKNGFILNPRKDLNNDQLINELNKCTTYIFIRNGNKGLYYYVGTSNHACRYDSNHFLLNLNTKVIPKDIIIELVGYLPLP